MGFFSSKKAEDDLQFSSPPKVDLRDKSVVQVLRSRFYGKSKGKERSPSFVAHTSVAQTLAGSSSTGHVPLTSSPLSNRSNVANAPGPSSLRPQLGRSNLSTPSKTHSTPSLPLPSLTMRPRNGEPPPPVPPKESSSSTYRKSTTDTVTVTLAQRLNELAVANSEGLLNDDEYRLLRQNLFERFASADIQMETPVSDARPRQRGNDGKDGRPTSRPLSNFQVEIPRPPSVNSKSSVAASVTGLLRRATSRRKPSVSKDYSDTSSIQSSVSRTSNIFKRGLSKKSSNTSLRTTISRNHADSISISSRQTGIGSDRTHSDNVPLSPGTSRSPASSRRFASPPSSFPAKIISADARYVGINDLHDEDHLKSSKEISQEILVVEAEAKRVIDAFNGLELTTLDKMHRRHGRPHIRHPTDDGRRRTDQLWSPLPDDRSQRRLLLQSDAASIMSAASGGTSPSVARSAQTGSKSLRPRGSSTPFGTPTRAGSVRRKNSVSSIASQGTRSIPPPVPSLPTSVTQSQFTGSAVSLTRSMSVVHEDGQSISMDIDDEERQMENELEDLRRRREEVHYRYEARLDYLRAKLKGAQLHEKVLKK